MKIEGDSVRIEKAGMAHVDSIHRWENDPSNWLVSDTVAPYSRDQIMHFIEENNDLYDAGQMRLMIMADDNAVGCIDLFDFDPKNKRVGIGILIDPKYRGKGMGHEAIDLVMKYCFDDLDIHSVYAEVLKSNTSSMKLFESASFVLKGVKTDWLWDGKSFIDQCFYQRIKEE